jgi:hypothetical protein
MPAPMIQNTRFGADPGGKIRGPLNWPGTAPAFQAKETLARKAGRGSGDARLMRSCQCAVATPPLQIQRTPAVDVGANVVDVSKPAQPLATPEHDGAPENVRR